LTKHAINIIIDAIMDTHSVVQRIRQRDWALALGVGFFLFAVYLLSYRGGFHSVDEVSMFAVTESLVKFGQFNTDQIAWTQWTTSQREAQGFFGVDGHVFSKKGLAISLAMAPLYWLGLVMPNLGMLQTASLLNAILTAVTGGTPLWAGNHRLGIQQVSLQRAAGSLAPGGDCLSPVRLPAGGKALARGLGRTAGRASGSGPSQQFVLGTSFRIVSDSMQQGTKKSQALVPDSKLSPRFRLPTPNSPLCVPTPYYLLLARPHPPGASSAGI
jgi:hypothetical protein